MSAPAAVQPAQWLTTAEKGSVWGIRLFVWLATVLGRRPTRLLLKPVALWYVLLHRGVRRSSAAWWQRVSGEQPRLAQSYQHVLRFAETVLDKCFFLLGRYEQFQISRQGHELLVQQHASGRGALLLSAHVGSTEAMGAQGYQDQLKIRVVGYFKNAAMINAALTALDPRTATRVVHIEPGSADSVLAIRDRVEAGEMLALAADRVGLNDRTVEVDFMGSSAQFPAGPFLLAAMLHCPVYFVAGLYRSPNSYELICERFADEIDLPRKDREAALRRWVSLYAARVEHYARSAPDNWFNFFDFWSKR